MPKGKRIKMRFPELPSLVRNRPLCFETDLAGIADYYGCNYAVPLCEYLDFTYEDADMGAISDRLHVRKPLPQIYSAYGAAFRRNCVTDTDEYAQHIHACLRQERPIIAHMDCYCLKWDPLFGKKHNEHTLLVAGERADAYYLHDPYFGKEGWIGKETFFRGSTFFYEFDPGDFRRWDDTLHEELFRTKVRRARQAGYFDGINRLSDDIRHTEISSDEGKKIFALLENAEVNKQRFLLFLHEWEKRAGQRGYVSLYSPVWSRWQVLKVLFLRAGYKGFTEKYRADIADYLTAIGREEEQVSERLIHVGSRPQVCFGTDGCVDISGYCNNKGMTERAEDSADCTGFGAYLIVDADNDLLLSHGLKLRSACEADNIACEGQTLCFVPDNAAGLTFLFIAEWGSYRGELRLFYTDGEEQAVPVYIKDWMLAGEVRVRLGSAHCYEVNDGEKQYDDVYADIVSVLFPEGKTLEKLILPDCRNIHILAIGKIA